MRHIFLLVIGITLLLNENATSQKTIHSNVSNTAPQWIIEMYRPNADYGLVKTLYTEYYKANKLVKNEHTQYFKRWSHQLRNNYLNDTSAIAIQNLNSYLFKIDQTNKSKSATSAWSCIGPIDFDKESVSRSYAPGAAHIYTVEQSLSTPTTLYAGTATAGLWKSTNKGLSWISITKNMAVNEVYAIEIDYTNANTMFFSDGNKIYKTIDGGLSFNPTGDAAFQLASHYTNDIKMSPINNQILLAATEQGLYRTIDGGSNWIQLQTGIWQEIEWHSTNNQIVYAVKQTGSATQFYKSIDGGQTFTIRTNGWPLPTAADENKRTEIAVTPAAPNIIYAFATGAANGGSGLYGIYVSHDAGESWTFNCCGIGPGGLPSATTNPNLCAWADDGSDDGGQFYYDLSLAVSPIDSNKVHVGAVNHWVSTDGGLNFTCPSKWSHGGKINYVHADIHDINYFGNDLWFACDGGIFYSKDGGDTITRRQFGIAGTDFWGFGAGNWVSEKTMLGGTYHNGTMIKDSNVYVNGWVGSMGGDNVLGNVNYGNERQIFSDYGKHLLSGNRLVGYTSLPNAMQPSSSYVVGEDAEMEYDPANYNIIYMGNGSGLWKSIDGGANYSKLYDFNTGNVTAIEVANDRTTIYVAHYPGWWNAKKLYRSTDGGQTFSAITPPNSLFNNGNYSAPFDIAVGDNPNDIWLVRTQQSGTYNNLDGYKVFKSTDGGTTWNNLTTPTLNGEYPTNIVYVKGSNGGVYIGTRRAVYYRNNMMSDFQLFNNQLPAITHSTQLQINYKLQKIRNATNRSVWECDLYETNLQPKAQISVDKNVSSCRRDTFYFVDHSNITQSSASWQWSFPGGNPSSSNLRNPKVTYSASGNYNVTLTVSDINGSNTQTLNNFISVLPSNCGVDAVPGLAVDYNGVDASASISPLNLNSNTVTMMAWIKPNGTQNDWAGIMFCRGGNTTCGLSVKNTNEIRYHWDGNNWNWSSGLNIIPNEWNHVALVITPNSATIYVNGIGATNTTSHPIEEFDAAFYLGLDDNGGSRYFKGLIDEVCIYNRSLTQAEVRETMHLTKNPSLDNSIKAYYQFNESGGMAYDKAGFNHASIGNTAIRLLSTGPFGGGTSNTFNITSNNSFASAITNVTLNLATTGTNPNGDVVVSRLNLTPDTKPSTHNVSRAYWVIDNFGINPIFTNLNSIMFDKTGVITSNDANTPSNFKLYSRNWNADGNTWGSVKDDAENVVAGNDGSVTFSTNNNISNFGQFVIESINDNSYLSSPNNLLQQEDAIIVYPTLCNQGDAIHIKTKNNEAGIISIYNEQGAKQLEQNIDNTISLSTNNLVVGNYFYKIVTNNHIQYGKIVIMN